MNYKTRNIVSLARTRVDVARFWFPFSLQHRSTKFLADVSDDKVRESRDHDSWYGYDQEAPVEEVKCCEEPDRCSDSASEEEPPWPERFVPSYGCRSHRPASEMDEQETETEKVGNVAHEHVQQCLIPQTVWWPHRPLPKTGQDETHECDEQED